MALYTTMKGPVDYTVVGSPTITNGVVSDFKGGNISTAAAFIKTSSNVNLDQGFDIKVYFTMPSSGRNFALYSRAANNTGGFTLQIPYNNNYRIAFFNSSRTIVYDKTLVPNDGTVTLQYDTSYIFKLKCSGGANSAKTFTLELRNADDTQTLYTYTNTTNAFSFGDCGVSFGVSIADQAYVPFTGSIDLNKTYINVNEQLWFGYEPIRVKIRTAPYARYTARNGVTIQNGVASGFAEGNAANAKNIDIPSIYPLTANSKIHLEFTPTQANFGSLLGKELNNYGYCIRYLSENTTSSYLDIYDTTGRIIHQVFNNQATIVTGNRHTFDLEYNGTTYTVLIKDIDTNTTIVSGSLNYTQPSNSGTCGFCIGGTRSSNYWYVSLKASVNLNNSYIQANGQYWWRGDMQNVETWTPHIFSNEDYFIENGKLIQVNPNIYCQSTGTQYIDTGILPNSNIEFDVKFLTSNTIGASGYGCIFGGRYNSGNNDLQVTTFKNNQSDTSGTFRFGLNSTDASQSAGITPNVATEAHFHNLTYSTNTVNYTVSTYNFTNPRKIFLFGLNGNGTFTQSGNGCKIYFAKFSTGTSTYHFVPVPAGLVIGSFTVPSNGMFDIVHQQFYANQGSGNFTIGKDE